MARRVYVCILVLLMVAAMMAGCGGNKAQTDVQTGNHPQDTGTTVNGRSTVLYFRDASGYVVPVMRKIPLEEGIAKAALKCLVAGSGEDVKLAAMGVAAPIPAETEIDLDIAKSIATVNLKMIGKCPDKESEQAMLAAVVNTLLEFATVDKVQIQINGQTVKKMPNGTAVSAEYDSPMLNIEPAGAPSGPDGKLELCFSNQAGRLVVPVYRVAGEKVSLAVALSEMMKPEDGTGLVSLFPPSCDVLDAKVGDDGVATIEFSSEFTAIADTPAMESMALRAIGAVCKQFHGVKDFKIMAGGKAFEPTVSTATSGLVTGNGYLNFYD